MVEEREGEKEAGGGRAVTGRLSARVASSPPRPPARPSSTLWQGRRETVEQDGTGDNPIYCPAASVAGKKEEGRGRRNPSPFFIARTRRTILSVGCKATSTFCSLSGKEMKKMPVTKRADFSLRIVHKRESSNSSPKEINETTKENEREKERDSDSNSSSQ